MLCLLYISVVFAICYVFVTYLYMCVSCFLYLSVSIYISNQAVTNDYERVVTVSPKCFGSVVNLWELFHDLMCLL